MNQGIQLATDTIRRWIRRAIIHRYFPEIWYLVENWLSDRSGSLLEIGCGRGIFTNALVQDSWNLTSVDPSRESIQRATERINKTGRNANFVHARPEKLPFENDSFDTITCINYLGFSPDPHQALIEAYRVLKPGGKAVIVAFRGTTMWALPWVASALRKDIPERSYHKIDLGQFKTVVIGSGFSIDSYKYRARYFPLQPKKSVIPWPIGGAIIALVTKPASGEQQVKVPPKNKAGFHK